MSPSTHVRSALILFALVVVGATVVGLFAAPSRAAAAPVRAGGATPIDSLPFVITQPGAYCVTDNLQGVAGSHGITVSSAQVTIDLGGFRVIGVVDSLDAIHSVGFGNLEITNGWISNWGESAIECSGLTMILDVSATACGGVAIKSQGNVVVERVTTSGNVSGDIDVGPDSRVRDCDLRGPGSAVSFAAVCVGAASDVSNVSIRGFDTGISAAHFCRITDCRVVGAHTIGVRATSSCRITGVMVHESGGDGITVDDHCEVVNNFCSDLAGDGIRTTGWRNIVGRNVTDNNAVGIRVQATNNLVVGNHAYGNTVQDIISPFPNPTGSVNRDFWWIGSKDPHTNFATPVF